MQRTAKITKNDFPGRSRWLLTVTLADGTVETSWHRAKAMAKAFALRFYGLEVER